MTTLSLLHRTIYRYRAPVQLLPHRLQLRPREGRELRLLSHDIVCTPSADLTWSRDVFGNEVATARFAAQSDCLTIESTALVELTAPNWPVFDIDGSAISYPFVYATEDWSDLGALAFDHGHTLFQREQRTLVAVDRHADHQPIHKPGGALDDIEMAQRNRIEGAGIETDAHKELPCPAARNNIAPRKSRGGLPRPALLAPISCP